MCRVPDRGVSGRRGFAVESAGARICCEGGARVTSNMMVQDVDLFVLRRARWTQVGNRGGWVAIVRAQLALDTILVSPHHCDGSPHRGAANVDLVVQEVLRQKKERTCPELVGPNARCRLVVLAGEREAGGPRKFGRVWGSWRRLKLERCPRFSGNVLNSLGGFEWGSLLACSAARAFSASLLDLRVSGGADGSMPTCHEIVHDVRFNFVQ